MSNIFSQDFDLEGDLFDNQGQSDFSFFLAKNSAEFNTQSKAKNKENEISDSFVKSKTDDFIEQRENPFLMNTDIKEKENILGKINGFIERNKNDDQQCESKFQIKTKFDITPKNLKPSNLKPFELNLNNQTFKKSMNFKEINPPTKPLIKLTVADNNLTKLEKPSNPKPNFQFNLKNLQPILKEKVLDSKINNNVIPQKQFLFSKPNEFKNTENKKINFCLPEKKELFQKLEFSNQEAITFENYDEIENLIIENRYQQLEFRSSFFKIEKLNVLAEIIQSTELLMKFNSQINFN